MRVSYGVDDRDQIKSLIHDNERVLIGFTDAVVPGRYLVNSLPILRYLPSWFPGAGWKRELLEISALSQKIATVTYNQMKERIVSPSNHFKNWYYPDQ